jgi:hypothetical protein
LALHLLLNLPQVFQTLRVPRRCTPIELQAHIRKEIAPMRMPMAKMQV